jgi:simple sugar transport system permease protein
VSAATVEAPPAEPAPAATSTPRAERAAGRGLAEAVLPALVALALAAVVGDLLILVFGESPGAVYRLLLEGTWGNAYGFGQVLYKATTLTFTGLAFAVAARAGLFNVGAEGQLATGGFAAALAGLVLPAGTPALVAAPLCVAAAALGGGLVGLLPGWLRARFGASEVIVTIMLNFVVLAVLNYVVSAHLHVPETLHTPDDRGRPAAAAGRPPAGVRRVGGQLGDRARARRRGGGVVLPLPHARRLRAARRGAPARRGRVRGRARGRVWVRAMALSGALAGVGGVNYVLGYKGYYEEGFATGAGFLGIAVALVGRNHPAGVLVAALLFATLSQGGLAVNAVVPKQMVDVLQAVVILAVVAAVPEVRRCCAPASGARARGRAVSVVNFLLQALNIAVPLLLAAAGGVLSERAGVIALALEGFMLAGAFGAALGSYAAGSPWAGVACGLAGGVLVAALHALAGVRLRADQVVTGVALNLLVVGATRFFLRYGFDSSSNSPRVPGFPVPLLSPCCGGGAAPAGARVAALPHAVRAARARRWARSPRRRCRWACARRRAVARGARLGRARRPGRRPPRARPAPVRRRDDERAPGFIALAAGDLRPLGPGCARRSLPAASPRRRAPDPDPGAWPSCPSQFVAAHPVRAHHRRCSRPWWGGPTPAGGARQGRPA